MATSASLTEPSVLAHTKRELFPGDDPDGYVVADTQFAQERWVDRRPIAEETKAALAPFNHVQVGTGYPDLVGVGPLDDDLLAVDRQGERPPLVVVEAKGYSGGTVDGERAVVQAHDRLDEANVAFVSAPLASIRDGERTLARELNVGVLGVTEGGRVEVLERPRVVGNRTDGEAGAIRFQAGAQGVAEKSFGLNHPKNYLAYPLAVAHDGETDRLVADHIVGAVDAARQGAAFLGLIDAEPRPTLTPLGREVVRFGLDAFGTLAAALADFESYRRSRKRFVDVAPRWGQVARRVVYAYPATTLLVEELQQMHDDGIEAPSLVELVEWLHAHHPTFTVELFFRGDEAVRERVLTEGGDLRAAALSAGRVYHSPTVFQLKAMLYHAGLLTDRGAEPSKLDPERDTWALCHPV
ncbi:hypothetical protein [Halomicrobium sp. LC1Hm]|uniref:hypothetical protein n=1 Tax=Halomicrobium sp. LC1Hm TaxID=2610902 RepID=UPI0012982480|nr:hypothetical protein [Halomicrobium sp. LC1Hm]QGA82062.1 Uncharacterized protein LC1Hm_1002 [Halomicrobium sp. LC1Hm]